MSGQTLQVERHSFSYIETTIPPGVTVSEYRQARPVQPSRLRALASLWSAQTGQRVEVGS